MSCSVAGDFLRGDVCMNCLVLCLIINNDHK